MVRTVKRHAAIPTQQNIKEMHLKQAFLIALRTGGVSRAVLKREMHLSFPSVSALVNELIDRGFLAERGDIQKLERGRPRVMLQVASQAALIPVVILTKGGYRYVLFDCCAQRQDEGFLPFASLRSNQEDENGIWHPDMNELFGPVMDWVAALPKDKRLADVIISIPGNLNQNGTLISSALKIRSKPNVLEHLREGVGRNVIVFNASDCYTYAEKFYQKLPDDFVFLNIGNGVGAGFIRNGKLDFDGTTRAGEVGHISIDYRGRPCLCGNCGCLERYISTKVITEEGERLLGRPVGAADFAFICMEYQKGTPEIVSLMEEKAALIAIGINNMLAVYPSKCVILGGGIEKLGPAFLELLRCSAKAVGFRRLMDRVTITYTKNTADDSALGAVWNYIDNFMELDA